MEHIFLTIGLLLMLRFAIHSWPMKWFRVPKTASEILVAIKMSKSKHTKNWREWVVTTARESCTLFEIFANWNSSKKNSYLSPFLYTEWAVK